MAPPRFDVSDKAALDEMIRIQRAVCDDLDQRIAATGVRAEAGRVLQQLLVWAQTCDIQEQSSPAITGVRP